MDKTEGIGVNKSLRIRTIIDLRKPIMREVELSMKGGTKESFKVAYDKLPLFCYVCGMLGHGEKDCDMHTGDSTPPRLYSEKQRVLSPWQPIRGERANEGSGNPMCARRQFVTKNTKKVTHDMQENVQGVVKQLKQVSLSLVKYSARGEDVAGEEREVVEIGGSSEEKLGTEAEERQTPLSSAQQGPKLSFEIGQCDKKTKKIRKVRLLQNSERPSRESKEVDEGAGWCGKRKDHMEIDVEVLHDTGEGSKKAKGAITGDSKLSYNSVAVVDSVQPREQQ